ncbi:GTP 3',8-cyclase MoaA [Ruficoccus amylovorans]|uniref:GTP 3',8-cyclase n=1 Tax=Ruficoccus amylovorans TaxID=1804625 RepID=A0A842HG32_9BACT|nr:GTP 3',8-cyclase MoaA [Ruficoccus amylovorans]MBC2595483.1 GTP 3',8-cyclase MoaA [Ruficoccus amylovorans]
MPTATLAAPSTPAHHALADQRGRLLRDLRLSVIDRCNLRCQYCLPARLHGDDFPFLPAARLLSFEQIEALVSAFIDLGVEKIRLTGGEPLLRPRLPELVARLRALGPHLNLALTTNGLRLNTACNELADAGLNRVNVSLDGLSPTVAERMAGRPLPVEQVWHAILQARSAGLQVKVNTVVRRGVNESEILPLARRCREHAIPLRFIEYMDVGTTNNWSEGDVVTGAEIRQRLASLPPLVPVPPQPGDVARRYRYADGSGEIGLINSISEPFCGGCTRARVSAEGRLYACLFASEGVDLKPWLSTAESSAGSLTARITSAWRQRYDRYSELRKKQPLTNRKRSEMWQLGG